MADVRLENVEKTYPGGCRAVRDLNLHVRDGEYLVLVGPSGCGKTTTLRLIAGLENGSAGRIQIGGRTVSDLPPRDRDVSMVFQNYALYPHLTVRQNMAFALRLRNVSKGDINQRVLWAADTLELGHVLDRRPHALSGGQRQRVAVGRAMVRRPQVFLFDEPLSNLDAQLRVELRAELKRLHQRLAATIIHVTHDQEEAMTLGDRVAVMCDGRVHQCDEPLVVYRYPQDRFVAGFVGMPAMNFVDGVLRRHKDEMWFEAGAVKLRLPVRGVPDLSSHIDRELVLGLRPDALQLERTAGDDVSQGECFDATVDVVETLGREMNVSCVTETGERMVCRAPTADLPTGSRITLRVDRAAAHLFEPNQHENDPDTPTVYGRNLGSDAQSARR